MNVSNYDTVALTARQMTKAKGGHPILVTLGVITTLVSVGRAVDQASQWFMEGWNNPA